MQTQATSFEFDDMLRDEIENIFIDLEREKNTNGIDGYSHCWLCKSPMILKSFTEMPGICKCKNCGSLCTYKIRIPINVTLY